MNAPFSPGHGFRDPVFGPQAIFRAVLSALSLPGRSVTLPDLGVEGPTPLPPAVLSLLIALCDHETPIWIDAEARQSAIGRWLAFHCNAPLTADPARAAFAVLRPGQPVPTLDSFPLGDPRYPDRSATLIVLCDALQGGHPISLEGPGIKTNELIAPAGLPDGFLSMAQDNHALFPCGVDFLLLAGRDLLGLPRSTRLTLPKEAC